MMKLVAPRAAMLVLAGSTLSLAAHGAGPTITDVAPPETMLVINVPDWSALKAAFDRTELKSLWNATEMQAFVKELTSDLVENYEEMLTDLGLEREDIVYPTGAVGMAVFMTSPFDEIERQIATTEGEIAAGAVIVADFGENADKFQKLLETEYDRLAERIGAEIRETAHGNATITSVIPPAEMDDDDDEDDFEEEFEDFDMPGVDLKMPFGSGGRHLEIHIVRLDGTYMFSDTLDGLKDAIDRAADPTRIFISNSPLFASSYAQHPADLSAMAIFRVGKALELVAANMTATSRLHDETAPDMGQIFRTLGLLGIETVSAGMRFDTADGMVETTMGVLAPEKSGLLAMFSRGTPRFQTPAFVPSDAAAATSFVIDISSVPALAREVISHFPEPSRTQASQVLTQAEPTVRAVVDALGNEIYAAQSYEQPFSPTSEQMVFGIRVTDQLVLGNLITTFGPQGGFEARDFQGFQLFEQKQMGTAVGLSSEWLFIGATPAVEDSLRRSANPGDDLLSEQPGFKAAAAPLEGGAVMTQYQDSERTIRYLLWRLQHAGEIADYTFDRLGFDEEFKAQMRAAREAQEEDWVRLLPPADLFVEHIGDVISEIRPTPDGFRGKTIILRPRD